ncbi:GNAT family N-acetyltransferase [Fibrobacter sp. UBA4309]|uniref:GNAT family N-acetyltransferase n=1 Tax=Fibrobacter sp. UBA4309 TaxID=1946537 RepID=UPI0025C33EA8|nr:GNAT family N-acetyltransferase [Fibrobacter sp. UBA4309]
MKIIRVTKESERAGAYYVRIQAMMHKYQIPLDAEVDSHDGANCNYILALDDIYPVATCRWFGLDSESAEIGRVVVLPEYRGQHLGQAVVAEAERWMREEAFKKAVISSRAGVEEFYKKLGYRFDKNGKPHHDTFQCVYMEKDL